MSAAPASHTPWIYGPAGVLTLISRGWNLCKANFKVSFTLLLVPVLLFSVTSLLMSIPSMLQPMLKQSAEGMLNYIMVFMLTSGLSFILSIVAWVLTMFCSTALCRVFYTALTQNQPISLKESFQFVRAHWLQLIGLFLFLVLINAGFVILEIGTLIIGVLLTMALIFTMGALHLSNAQAGLGAGIITILVGFLTVLFLYGLFVLQILMTVMPISAFGSLPPGKGLVKQSFRSIRALMADPGRSLLYGSVLMVFYVFLVMFLQTPMYIYWGFEFQRLSNTPELLTSGVLPMHLYVVTHIWSSLVNAVVWSFMFACLSLFYYDCQVRQGALDLRLRLAQLAERMTAKRGRVQSNP